MKKVIALITGTERTRQTIENQINSYIGDIVKIESYSIDMGIDKKIKADLVIISTILIYDDAIKYLESQCPVIIARRVLNYSSIEKILFMPVKEEVLFVNDCRETAEECIDWLKRLGVNYLNYVPYYPGVKLARKIKRAITPGEIDLVPEFVEEVVDIGTRLLDMTTIVEVLKELDLFEEKWEYISEKYMSKIIDLARNLAEITQERTEAYHHIRMVMDGVKDGILAFNHKGYITVLNENLRFLLQIRKKDIIGKDIRDIIRDKNILDFLLNGAEHESKAFKINGLEILLNRFEIRKEDTIAVTFKNSKDSFEVERQLIRELYNKGYYAKYTFEDIIGESIGISETKHIAAKVAATDLTVLIEGESGTGKELFASAIHNASSRKNKPFVAVNFSALSENLLESELFGYEDGAFTGAAKGGKAGLFEQADGGTIFLDEIGDASQKVQLRLLRVLQEKEIMRVGGSKIITVDVRIVSATNQNLANLVEKGLFRSDLYHRLKVLYVNIPPLRKRKEDITHMIQFFMQQKGMGEVIIEQSAINKLLSYPWYGNVRELKNTIDYMAAVSEGDRISLSDLPQENFFQGHNDEDLIDSHNIMSRGDMVFILKNIYEYMVKGEKASRQKLVSKASHEGICLTEQMIRQRLDELEELGYIKKTKGKTGTTLTSLGVKSAKEIYK